MHFKGYPTCLREMDLPSAHHLLMEYFSQSPINHWSFIPCRKNPELPRFFFYYKIKIKKINQTTAIRKTKVDHMVHQQRWKLVPSHSTSTDYTTLCQ